MSTIILASASRARNEMLQNAGLNFISVPADIDETKIIAECLSQNDQPEKIARTLAQQKALHVAQKNPDALVIGSDQILEYGGAIFEKAQTIDHARKKLKLLRGDTHRLISAVCIAQNNKIIWDDADKAELTMRSFDDVFLDRYLEKAKDDILSCVGGYALEKSGIILFSNITGNYHTILGMPLLKLLSFLQEQQGIEL